MRDVFHDLSVIVENGDALRQQIAVFLNTRAGEIEYDLDMGINFDFILNPRITADQVKSYYTSKLLKYFGTEITSIKDVVIVNNARAKIITIKYQSIYGVNTEITTQWEV